MKNKWVKFDDSILYNKKEGLYWVKGRMPSGHAVSGGMFSDWQVAHKVRDKMQLDGHLQFEWVHTGDIYS